MKVTSHQKPVQVYENLVSIGVNYKEVTNDEKKIKKRKRPVQHLKITREIGTESKYHARSVITQHWCNWCPSSRGCYCSSIR